MLLSVSLRSPLSGVPPSPLGAGGAPLPSPLSPPAPPTPAALQQAALQAALLARHRQLIAQARPARHAPVSAQCSLQLTPPHLHVLQMNPGGGGDGGGYPTHWAPQLRAGAGGGAAGYPGGGAGSMMSLLMSPNQAQRPLQQPTPTQQRGSPLGAKAKVTRSPTAYNLHMRDELKRLKAEQPSLEHRDAWRIASGSVRHSLHGMRRAALTRRARAVEKQRAESAQRR